MREKRQEQVEESFFRHVHRQRRIKIHVAMEGGKTRTPYFLAIICASLSSPYTVVVYHKKNSLSKCLFS